ncbi:MAG TPA: nuclear transport factor 2 family protein, partial [Crenalkalicoccus sp.]|nr:nuclear transport factor 2 family protein [Crenalkalicoccus sp.]
MDTQAIARDFVALCKQGKFAEAGEKYWAEDVVSIEPMGEMRELRGKAAVRGKGEWWYANHEVHSAEAYGPYLHGDQFAVHFKLDVTPKGGQRMQMQEIALYTLKDGK